MVRPKPKSKRQTSRHRAKVVRKVREHNRKLRKETKIRMKAGGNTKARQLRHDPGIPKTLPEGQREAFLAKLQADAAQEQQHKQSQRSEADKLRALAQQAHERSSSFEQMAMPTSLKKLGVPVATKEDPSKRAFMRDFRQVVAASDVVLEVLDARDPIGSRVHQLEKLVMEEMGGKKIVLVLNKADLVPPEVRQAWLKYLRGQFPCVLFKSSTQEQRSHLGQTEHVAALDHKTSECVGAASLLQLLKNYSRAVGGGNAKTRITVGVVGYPNVGKSSLINSLKRARVCRTGSTPGLTTSLQNVHLDGNLVLIDSPGIVFSGGAQESLILQNCVRIEQLEDPVEAVQAICAHVPPATLAQSLDLAETPMTPEELLRQVAVRRGKVLKGGRLDIAASARAVLQDWNSGKIPFHREVPTVPAEQASKDSLQIVSQWAPLFDLDAVYAMADE